MAAQRPPKDDYKLSTADVRRDVIAVIGEQLAHFRAGEPEKAYTLAAARFREQFPLERFVTVVRQSYPEIWSSSASQFGVVRDDGVSAVVVVQVTSKEGRAVGYDYFLLREANAWRIGGVVRHAESKPQA